MLSIILASALLGQFTEADFFFIRSQENWVIDQLEGRVFYSRFIPAEVTTQVDMWFDDCHRCRTRASQAILDLGPRYMRWMFWTIRSKDCVVQLYSEAMLKRFVRCTKCRGVGVCDKYVGEPLDSAVCANCWFSRSGHETEGLKNCKWCGGTGYFERAEPTHRSYE